MQNKLLRWLHLCILIALFSQWNYVAGTLIIIVAINSIWNCALDLKSILIQRKIKAVANEK